MTTLRTIVARAFEICSTDKFLEKEIEYIREVFYNQKNYPLWIIDRFIHRVKEKPKVIKLENDESGNKKHRFVLPYKGDKGTHILRSMENYVSKLLPKKSTPQITYTGKKLSSQFNIKNNTNFEHQHGLIYHVKCSVLTCEENYTGETLQCIHESIKDLSGRDHMLHMLKHSLEKHHDIMRLKKTLKSLLRTLKITNGNEKYRNHFG